MQPHPQLRALEPLEPFDPVAPGFGPRQQGHLAVARPSGGAAQALQRFRLAVEGLLKNGVGIDQQRRQQCLGHGLRFDALPLGQLSGVVTQPHQRSIADQGGALLNRILVAADQDPDRIQQHGVRHGLRELRRPCGRARPPDGR